MNEKNNKETIRLLNEKNAFSQGKEILVRIEVYDKVSCVDFEYIPISELILKLENNEIELKPEDLETFIVVD